MTASYFRIGDELLSGVVSLLEIVVVHDEVHELFGNIAAGGELVGVTQLLQAGR
jgi:hypothetical protein